MSRGMNQRLRRLSVVALALAVFSPGAVRAQIPTPHTPIDDNQARAGTRWRSISTPHFDVVFPLGLAADAQRVAATLERLHIAEGKTMGAPPKRITVVLQNQSTVSNGGVGLGPRRMEWITTPPGFSNPPLLGANDWLSLLATHETRHVAQFDQTKVGFTSFLHTLFGDLGQVIVVMETPGWLWEGDAVGTETALSSGGRGRMPAFDKEIRALALDGRLPGYYPAMLGSYAHFFPDRYPLGYLLTTRLRRTQGPNVIDRVFRRSAARSWNPFTFHFAVKRETQLSPPQLYDSTMRELSALWRAQLDGLALTNAERRSPVPRVYTNYNDPQLLSDGSLVALRTGLADVRQVVRIDAGRVTPLADAAAFGIRAGGMLVAWTEVVRHPRWGQSDHTEIRVLDAHVGRARTLGGRGRWAFPVPSPDGRRVAAIETKETGGSSVVVLDATTGARLQTVEVPEREHAMDPSWRADGHALVFTRQGLRGKALTLLDLSGGGATFTDLIPHGFTDVTRPVFAGDFVLYVSPYSGIDNVYAIHTQTGARFQVTSRRVGAYQPAVSSDARRLVFADYTSDGSAVMEMALDPTTWTPLDSTIVHEVRYYEPLVAQEQFTLAPAEIAADTAPNYPVRRFSGGRLEDRFRVHSWFPVLDYGEYGAGVRSTDVLNTLASNLTVRYNVNEHASSVSAGASYGGFYPILETQAEFGARSTSYKAPGDTATLYSWRERSVEAGVRLPLDFSRGLWFRSVALGAHVGYSDVSGLAVAAAREPGNGSFVPVTFGLQAANIRARARRDLAPRWGQSLFAQYRYTPLGGDFRPRIFGVHAVGYLPAPVRHHGLRVSAELEDHESAGPFRFSSDMTEARGYDFIFGSHMEKMTADYSLPLAYPDVALGPVLYIPRITAGAFYDHFKSTGARAMASAGVELLAEVIPFSWQVIQFSAGARLVYRLLDSKLVVEPAIRAGF
jgi:hypothetical protein